ncbi:MAG: DUF4105 domain-containing protein [Schleiferiaceae bacterium]|nr:DUF4105 domain-containing protein [Schleiferiaceae bacterium]
MLRYLLVCLLPLQLLGQWQLSEEAEIRVLTCGPAEDELYSAFGHSAVRVKDPVSGLDLVYNYGVFDFDQPNFYLNFTRGHLRYQLAVQAYDGFLRQYRAEGRYVHEQVLNLSAARQQAYFDFLQVNALPANRTYNYDYFYDNCATRIRDGLKAVLGDSLRFDTNYVERQESFREACDRYLTRQPWGDLGIDLCLGMPMDKQMSDKEYMFLPDYIEKGFEAARLLTARGHKPLVKDTEVTVRGEKQADFSGQSPLMAGWGLLVMGLVVTLLGKRWPRISRIWDGLSFPLVGLLGWLLLLLWLATDHAAAAENFNILWAVPLHFPLALWGWRSNMPTWLRGYFRAVTWWYGLVVLGWFFFPQALHPALFPLALLLGLRAAVRGGLLLPSRSKR